MKKKLMDEFDQDTDENPMDEPCLNTLKNSKKKGIRQAISTKSIPDDPWEFVPHTELASRKAVSGNKIKTSQVNIVKITSQKKFIKMIFEEKIKHQSLQRRKAVQIHPERETIPQMLKNILKDYNAVDFLLQR